MAHTFHFQIYYDSVTAHSSGLFVILIYRLLGTKKVSNGCLLAVSYTHLDVYKRQAILMLVFKDSIMGFVSGVQLSVTKLKVGDWIEMPKYGANGTVIEVTLNTVKVRNWDNTVTTIRCV